MDMAWYKGTIWPTYFYYCCLWKDLWDKGHAFGLAFAITINNAIEQFWPFWNVERNGNGTVTERVTLYDFMERNETERGVQVWITERNAFHSLCNDLHH